MNCGFKIKFDKAVGLVFFALLGSSGIAQVSYVGSLQKNKVETPKEPFLNPAPQYSEWLESYSYPQDRPGKEDVSAQAPIPPLSIRKTLTTKTGNILHEEVINVAGKKIDKWQVDKTLYLKRIGHTSWVILSTIYSSTFFDPELPIPSSGFQYFDWLKSENFAGIANSGGKNWYVFVDYKVVNPEIINSEKLQSLFESNQKVACIDIQTKLPVRYQFNGVIVTYTYNTPPNSMQSLPPELAKLIKESENQRAKLSVVPKAEY